MLIDADVIIRFLTHDDPQKSVRFEKFLQSDKKAILTDVTFAEIYWTLLSFYKFSKPKIITALESLLNQNNIKSNRNILWQTLEILKNKAISFIDAYNAGYSIIENDRTIMSYDRGFNKISQIKRVEP